MGKPQTLEDCKNRADFERWAVKKGAVIEYGGRHPKVVTSSGAKIPLAGHGAEDIPIGTRRSMIKMFIALGLALAVIFVITRLILPMIG